MKRKMLFLIALLATLASVIHMELRYQKALQEISTLREENEDLQFRLEIGQSIINRQEDEIMRLNKEIAQLKARPTEVPKTPPQKTNRGGKPLVSLGKYTVTAYCSCEKCCGKYAENRPGGKVYGANGTELIEGESVAAWLPFGTKLMIGDKEYTVQDRTAKWIRDKYEGRIIDLYYGNHAEALKWGKQEIEVFRFGE